MKKKVTIVELSVFERITPLVSGYLQAYASEDPEIRASYTFDNYSTSIKTPITEVLRDVLGRQADVYAFSCYVWNMGSVQKLLPLIRQAQPDAEILLGGPQVMKHGLRYLDPADPHMAVCNGEGEIAFADYLRELTEFAPDLARVGGLSFFRDGALVTTPERARITDLNTIPSPFLTGLFEPKYSMSILETNRGCPYHCGFCFWGAATNDRVYRFDEERVRDEITWMSRNDVLFLYIADANWGMLSRDVEFSEHIAAASRERRFPSVVYFSSAKNKPHAVSKITGIFQDAGLVTSQPISMQTLEPKSLDLIARSNIKLKAFSEVQDNLRDKGLSSFIELIWPLPGETLDSFKRGIGTLCDNSAQTIIAYSHLLLNNTPIYHNREKLGLVTRPAGGGVADARIVVETEQVSADEFVEGMRYFYALHAIHNTRSLRLVSRYLNAAGKIQYSDLVSAFVDYWRTRPADDPIVEFVERSIRDAEYYDVNNYGLFIHTVLHAERSLFNAQVLEFARSQAWWEDPQARALFAADLLNRPYVYSNTPLDPLEDGVEPIRLLERGRRSYTVEIGEDLVGALSGAVRSEDQNMSAGTYTIDHKRLQYPYMASQSLDHNGGYCHGMIEKVENIVPVWTPVG
ncbi:cobalamin-dependent protein [Streptomyces sp. NBC_00868]|uniref:cobalamin-dependent protein n=1 Tax=Streptomyces sp. NBC_00868 TaxID=2903683 RepID=UPI00387092CD|nr:cobalamin-dependent protein [Streptomyces sp. NBC_00868]